MFSRLYTLTILGLMGARALATPAGTKALSVRQSFSGSAGFFFQNGIPGTCGQVHSDQDFIVALGTETYANGAHCGATIIITDNAGKAATGVVASECLGCGTGRIELSVGLFNVFAPESVGVFPASWFL